MTRIGYTNTVHGTRRTALIWTLDFFIPTTHFHHCRIFRRTQHFLPFRLYYPCFFPFLPPGGVRAARSFPLYSCSIYICDLTLRHYVVSVRLIHFFFFTPVHLLPLAVAPKAGPATLNRRHCGCLFLLAVLQISFSPSLSMIFLLKDLDRAHLHPAMP